MKPQNEFKETRTGKLLGILLLVLVITGAAAAMFGCANKYKSCPAYGSVTKSTRPC